MTTESQNKASESKIIRKLGVIERYFHDEIEIGSSINASTILLSSKIDIFSNVSLFNTAVKLWKRTQPFLRSKVIHLEETNAHNTEKICKLSFNENKTVSSKYFAFVDESDCDQNEQLLPNVYYLNFKSSSTDCIDVQDTWKLLIEREFTIPIDWENGPMWRLNLINLGKENEKYKYCLIISLTHAIFDGSSAFVSLVGLFMIFEALYTQQLHSNSEVPDAKVIRPVEEFANEYILKKSELNETLAEYKKIDGFKQPTQLLISQDVERKQYIPVENLKEFLKLSSTNSEVGFYSAIDNKLIVKLDKLLEISKSSVTKFYFNKLDGSKFKQFLQLCKTKNCKLTGVFNTMFILAWRMVYKKFCEETSNENDVLLKEKIHYLTIVNLRSFLKEIEMDSLIWFCNNLYSTYDREFNTNEHDFWHAKFWNFSKQESDMFHDRLKRGEQFKLLEQSKPIEKDETRLHYGLSNLVVPAQLTKEIKLFEINDLYTLTSYRRNWTNDFSYNNIISIEETMCWTLSYNSYFLKNEVAEYFIQSVLSIYDKLLSENEF
jgi:hypothetical protein